MALPVSRTFCSTFSSCSVRMLASAAAAASGLPPYDDDDPLGLAHGFAWAIAPFATTPLIGNPAPNSGVVAKGAIAQAKDRKSTRLNSSHGYISYAVFCLKKKT